MDSRLSHATSERQNLMQPGLTGVTSSPALEGHSQRKSQPLSPLRTAAACDIDRGRAPSTACQPELAPWRGWISCSAQPPSRPEHTAQHPPYPPCARDLPLLYFYILSSLLPTAHSSLAHFALVGEGLEAAQVQGTSLVSGHVCVV